MHGNHAAAPDLQDILATLSQFTNTAPSRDAAPAHGNALPPLRHLGGGQVEPSTHQDVPAERASDPRLKPQSRSAAASPKPIDPANITTWQEGLRCVTKIAAQNNQFSLTIRRMIDSQRKHELQWYSERQALKQAQAKRSAASAKAQSILQSLGNGTAAEPPATQSESDKQVELATFDRKIYAAQAAMEEAMVGELKGLGVPFFGTEASLVVPDGSDASKCQGMEIHAKWSPVVTESDLMALRRKMVGHLEDLYRD